MLSGLLTLNAQSFVPHAGKNEFRCYEAKIEESEKRQDALSIGCELSHAGYTAIQVYTHGRTNSLTCLNECVRHLDARSTAAQS